jgi:hypothetical protein
MKTWLGSALVYFLVLTPVLLLFQNCSNKQFQSQMMSFSSQAPVTFGVEAAACSPTLSRVCREANGVGIQFCDVDGAPKACQIESCESGFNLKDGKCEPQACKPNATASCEGSNGTGVRTCNIDGLGFGVCELNACSTGFKLENKACVALACQPNTSLSCSIENGMGLQTCKADGSGYMGCKVM